jgi:VanZ family protein
MTREAGVAVRQMPPAYQRTARRLAVAIALLIVWGSLYPFEFQWPTPELLAYKLAHAGSHFLSHADLMANFLLYMPLGLACLLALQGASAGRRILRATLAGSALSLSMELAQLATLHRVTSLYDWLLNSAGACVGACGMALYLKLGERRPLPGLVAARPALVPLWLLIVWFAAQFAPFGPALSWSTVLSDWHASGMSWTAGLQGITRAPPGLSAVLSGLPALNAALPALSVAFASSWVLAECARHILRPALALPGLAALITITLLGRLLLGLRPLGLEELGAWCAALFCVVLTARWGSRSRAALTAVACVAALILQGLWPFAPGATINEFHWIPFSGSLLASRDYQPLLDKLFLYGALLWSLAVALRRLDLAFIMSFLLTLAVELGQLWMPQRRAEITDPLLIVALAAAFAIAARFQSDVFGAGVRVASGRGRTPQTALF